MTTLSLNLLRFGREEPPPLRIALRAGPLDLIYEAGDLRAIRLGEAEIVQRIYAAVRDRNWGTVPMRIAEERIEHGENWFRISYVATHREGTVDFTWRASIRGDENGTISFSFDGTAGGTFLRNRIGLCIHHPGTAAGSLCTVTHSNGTIEHSVLPEFIAPHQPFFDIRAFAHEAAPGVWARLAVAGDVFEMEDQRNWTDDSFKTYSTPVALPYPVEVAAGTRIVQSITLTLEYQTDAERTMYEATRGSHKLHELARIGGDVLREGHELHELARIGDGERRVVQGAKRTMNEATRESHELHELARIEGGAERSYDHGVVELRPLVAGDAFVAAMPPVGLALADSPLDERVLARLVALHPAFLRADLRLSDPAYHETLLRATEVAGQLGCELELALHVADEVELRELAERVVAVRPPVRAWLVFPTDAPSTTEPWAVAARSALAGCAPGALLGGGSDFYFTQLNRGRPPIVTLDLVSFALNPQVHAFDEASLVENLAGQTAALASARALAAGLPVAVSPVTLRTRVNPDATGVIEPPLPGTLPPNVDARQMSLFGAAWTLGSLVRLATGGAASATFYETHGWRGVQLAAGDVGLPPPFDRLAGVVFPLYHVLADACGARGAPLLPVATSAPRELAALAFDLGEHVLLLLANLTPDERLVRVGKLSGEVWVRTLDDASADVAIWMPDVWREGRGAPLRSVNGQIEINLGPYATARIEGRT
jgi:hypothetical protein